MADGDVELSEHTEHGGNDDIDIDIDLLTTQQDEDFILEDAESDKDLEDTTAGNDDIMQDEENASYQMDDVDIMQEEHVENLQMEDAYQPKALGADFTSTEMSHNQSDIPEEYIQDLNGASEAAMDDLTDHTAFSRDGEGEQEQEVQGASDKDYVKRREAGNFQLPPQLLANEENSTNQEQSEGQNPSANSRTTSPKSAGPSKQNQTDHEGVSGPGDPVAQGHNGADPVADQGKYIPQPKVIVVWHDAEYDLMAASDTDDPDSFFLTDTKLIKESFPNFLAALRDVVLDELNIEDELCLTIEDLGLEVTEMSSTIHDMSFEDVLNLYGKLLRNDGVEIPGPLYITLGTKPHFAKRLANLVAGAAKGKGLSELVSWEEGSQELGTEEQSIDPESNEQRVADHSNNLRVVDDFTHQENESEPDVVAEEDAPEDLAQETAQATDGINSAEEYDQADNDEKSNGQTAPQLNITADEQVDLGAQGQFANSAGTQLADYQKEDVDEDGDLIDYSDDELLPNDEPVALADSLAQANEDSTLDAINENPRQRSLSLTAEQNKPQILYQGQSDDLANEQSNAYLEFEPGSYGSDGDPDDGVGHAMEEKPAAQVWDDEDEYDSGSKDGEAPVDANEHQVTSEDVVYDDEITEGDDAALPASEIIPNRDHSSEDNRIDVEDYDGIDQSIKNQGSVVSTLGDGGIASDLNNPTLKNDVTKEAYVDPDEISYEEVEGLNSKHSEQTLLADETVQNAKGDGYEEVLHDEISYEDDDHQDLSISSEPKFTIDASPTANGQSGKRPRSDAEGAADGSSKYSKRLRS